MTCEQCGGAGADILGEAVLCEQCLIEILRSDRMGQKATCEGCGEPDGENFLGLAMICDACIRGVIEEDPEAFAELINKLHDIVHRSVASRN